MSKTEENLRKAFAGESQANRKYLAFAGQAEKEGYPQVAKLFRAAAESETIHAHTHFRVLGGIKSTAENLEVAIEGETQEFEKMYPEMIETAQAEQQQAAERSFTFANKVEQVHAGLYRKALETLNSQVEVEYYICPGCGYTAENEAPETCPVCGAPREKFYQVN